ncbi:hypothetical protein AB6A40_004466 [Gnathostoma spinigerum]|uniref:Uncharacterized protein n=1 Tax=Gnathostoma spinigerum TaxID=75299 RepID=A0ABD6EEQ9_9BILA
MKVRKIIDGDGSGVIFKQTSNTFRSNESSGASCRLLSPYVTHASDSGISSALSSGSSCSYLPPPPPYRKRSGSGTVKAAHRIHRSLSDSKYGVRGPARLPFGRASTTLSIFHESHRQPFGAALGVLGASGGPNAPSGAAPSSTSRVSYSSTQPSFHLILMRAPSSHLLPFSSAIRVSFDLRSLFYYVLSVP